MALTDGDNGNGFFMPVAPAYGGGGFGNGMNGFGGDWAWIILLLLLGWGNNGYGNGGFGGGNGDFPWLMTGQQNINTNTNNGFRDAMINDGITSIRDGIGNLSTQLCNCCGDMQMALANGFAGVEQSANARQMADMNQNFGLQTAMLQGFNGVQSQFANCCCENRLGIANLGADIAREACATRTSDTQNTQAILNVVNGGIQSIKDQLCQDKIDTKNDEIAQLRQELLYARGQASQDVQTAVLRQGQEAEVDALYNRLNNCPVGTVPVYGRQPIFTCNNNGGCNCGCGNNF